MASSTRFGYTGSGTRKGEGGPGAPEPGKATVFGRAIHLGASPQGRPAEASDVAAAGASLPPPQDAPAAKMPSHSGKSGFPARAGFWGRRNSRGGLEAGDSATWQDEDLDLPAPGVGRFARPVIVVLASALLSFIVVLITLRAGGPVREEQKRPPAEVGARPASVPPSTAARPAVAPLRPEPGELAPPRASDAALKPRLPERPVTAPPPRTRARSKAARRDPPSRGSADDILPPGF